MISEVWITNGWSEVAVAESKNNSVFLSISDMSTKIFKKLWA